MLVRCSSFKKITPPEAVAGVSSGEQVNDTIARIVRWSRQNQKQGNADRLRQHPGPRAVRESARMRPCGVCVSKRSFFDRIYRINRIRWDGRGWWIAAEPLWRSSYALRGSGVMQWRVTGGGLMPMGAGVHGAAVSDLTISRRLPESF